MEQTAKKRGKTYEMDMCNGPLFPKIIAFAVPLILSGILQLLFNAADIIVVGHFAGRESLAAVGSTTALINLMINVFVGLSIGANVLVAQYSGAQKHKDLEETVHTAMMIALAGGILLIFIGVCFSGPMLTLMGTPDDVFENLFHWHAGHADLQLWQCDLKGGGRHQKATLFSAFCRCGECGAESVFCHCPVYGSCWCCDGNGCI